MDHYKDVALKYGLAANSTMKDQVIRDCEVAFLIGEVGRFENQHGICPEVLDIGCGNGYALSKIHEAWPQLKLFGLEFTPELLELAQKRATPNMHFRQGDCRQDLGEEFVDIIITERVIINMLQMEDQRRGLTNICRALKQGGRYLMIESFIHTLENLNRARSENGLDVIPVSYQNRYIREEELSILKESGLHEIEGGMKKNYLSTHFFNTRVFHHLIRPEGAKQENTETVKFLDEALGPGIGNYSPILFRVFEKAGSP